MGRAAQGPRMELWETPSAKTNAASHNSILEPLLNALTTSSICSSVLRSCDPLRYALIASVNSISWYDLATIVVLRSPLAVPAAASSVVHSIAAFAFFYRFSSSSDS